MKILALDTSATACSVALLLNDKIHARHEIASMQQAQRVLPMVEELLKSADLKLEQLDALAFGCGPGSFTGVRIAASVMQGFAFATQIPLIKISSLAAVAQAAYDDLGWKKLLVGMDARIEEVYWGVYQIENGLAKLQGSEVVCPPQNISIPEGDDWYAVGSAWEVYRENMLKKAPHLLAVDASRLPMASAIALLAKNKFLKKDYCALADALPVYLRNNVAEKSK